MISNTDSNGLYYATASLSAPAYWQSWALTDVGKHRRHNEDAILNKPEVGLWAVADGMGGHQAGDIASQLIIDRLAELTPVEPFESYVFAVKTCLQNVNDELRQLAERDYGNAVIGSTVVALLCNATQGAFLWVGDSRLYRLRNQQLRQLTEDHCPQIGEHLATPWSLKNCNLLTRAVGVDDSLSVDVELIDIADGDVFLLCSDGVDKEMSLNDIEHLMQHYALEDIATHLMREVLARGGRDNISIIVVGNQPIAN